MILRRYGTSLPPKQEAPAADEASVDALLALKYKYHNTEIDDHCQDHVILTSDTCGTDRRAAARAILSAIKRREIPGVRCE